MVATSVLPFSVLPSPLLSPNCNTGPPVQQHDYCSEEHIGDSAVLLFHFRNWCELVVLCKPASWSSLLAPPQPHMHSPYCVQALELLS